MSTFYRYSFDQRLVVFWAPGRHRTCLQHARADLALVRAAGGDRLAESRAAIMTFVSRPARSGALHHHTRLGRARSCGSGWRP
jgi:hypothetical protein